MKPINKNHVHTYDAQGRMTCCTLEEKIYTQAGAKNLLHSAHKEHKHTEDEEHTHEHDSNGNLFQAFLPSISSFIFLISALVIDHFLHPQWFSGWVRIAWYVLAYIPVGIPVLKEAAEGIVKGDVFSEFFLMGLATVGAFAIGEYPEAVAVMLFYAIGELFQTLAIKRAQANIQSLLDQRPDEVTIVQENQTVRKKAQEVQIGEIIQLKPGEKLALDGKLLSDNASFNTAALTGESKPDTKKRGDTVLAGMINRQSVAQVQVNTAYTDSKLSKLLTLVQEASAKKAPTELFIRKFAKVYTPIIVALSLLICLLPYFFVAHYTFSEWLYRALIFLVISCPCALVISIPLGYFGGIGAASRKGILIKGSNYLDLLASVQAVIMDKTGTLTEGVFQVQAVKLGQSYNPDEILMMVNALENISTHPVATAIRAYVGPVDPEIKLENPEEIAGYGLKAKIQGKELLVGNFKWLDKCQIPYTVDIKNITYTLVAIAYDQKFVGYITIADRIKPDALTTIQELKQLKIKSVMLSGDKSSVVADVAQQLGIIDAFGDLLPEDKVTKVKAIKAVLSPIVFVGDGVNDAPALALSDVGIAMGGLGSDAAIETADVVIQDDKPSKIAIAIAIGKQTQKIVWQNILLAFTVKIIVLILGAGGVATMWEAVFADVGVALLAIFNAVRIQQNNSAE